MISVGPSIFATSWPPSAIATACHPSFAINHQSHQSQSATRYPPLRVSILPVLSLTFHLPSWASPAVFRLSPSAVLQIQTAALLLPTTLLLSCPPSPIHHPSPACVLLPSILQPTATPAGDTVLPPPWGCVVVFIVLATPLPPRPKDSWSLGTFVLNVERQYISCQYVENTPKPPESISLHQAVFFCSECWASISIPPVRAEYSNPSRKRIPTARFFFFLCSECWASISMPSVRADYSKTSRKYIPTARFFFGVVLFSGLKIFQGCTQTRRAVSSITNLHHTPTV